MKVKLINDNMVLDTDTGFILPCTEESDYDLVKLNVYDFCFEKGFTLGIDVYVGRKAKIIKICSKRVEIDIDNDEENSIGKVTVNGNTIVKFRYREWYNFILYRIYKSKSGYYVFDYRDNLEGMRVTLVFDTNSTCVECYVNNADAKTYLESPLTKAQRAKLIISLEVI